MEENSTDLKVLKKEIMSGSTEFMDILYEILYRNKVIYSDNFGEVSSKERKVLNTLETFMHLLYSGSKHTVGSYCTNGFSRVVYHNGIYMLFTYFSGNESFVTVDVVEKENITDKIVTMELLKERLEEAEMVKSELGAVINKYMDAGLTYSEITTLFVDVVREYKVADIKNLLD